MAILQYDLQIKTDKANQVIGQLKSSLEKLNPNIKVDINQEIVNNKIKLIENQIKGLSNQRIDLQINTDTINAKIKKVQSDLANLKSQQSTPEIDLKIANAEGKLATLQNKLGKIKNAEVTIDIKQSNLDTNLRQVTKKFDQAGKTAGTSFGEGIAGAITGVLAGFSLNNLIGQISGAVEKFRDVQGANLALGGAITASNNKIAQQNKVLNSSSSSLEQRALALGLDTSKMYENVSASQQSSNATQGLENSLKSQTRAFEDSQKSLESKVRVQEQSVESIKKESDGLDKQTRILDKNIQRIQDQTNEKIKALRLSLGSGELDKEKLVLETKKNNLEISKDQAVITNNPLQVLLLEAQIKNVNNLISLNSNKLDSINLQTDALQAQTDSQIQALEAEKKSISNQKESVQLREEEARAALSITQELLKANQITFDTDIEPIKRKIEDIRDSISSIGGGSTKVISKAFEDAVRAAEIKAKAVQKVDPVDIDKVANNLVARFGKTLAKGDITSVLGQLIQSGLTDSVQLETITSRYIETASRSSVGTKNLGQAINNLAEDFKGQVGRLGQTSGLTENYNVILDKGVQVLREQALAAGDVATAQRLASGQLTDSETRQAQYQGTIELTNDTVGAYANQLNKGLLAQSEFNKSLQDLTTTAGEDFNPTVSFVLQNLTNLVNGFNALGKENPNLIVGITGLTGVLTLAGIAFGILTAGALIFGITLAPLITPFLLITGAVIILTAQFFLLKEAWDKNLFGIRDTANNVFGVIGGYIEDFKNNWQERIGQIIGFFSSLPFKLPILVAEAVTKIFDFLKNYEWGKAWDGLVTAASGAWEGIKKLFSFENLKTLGNGLRSFFIGIVRGIFSGVPGADAIINPILDRVPKFKDGGFVSGAGTGTSDSIRAMLSNGEFIVNAQATSQYRPILEQINARSLQSSTPFLRSNTTTNTDFDYSVSNKNNITNNNNYSTDTRQSRISQQYRYA